MENSLVFGVDPKRTVNFFYAGLKFQMGMECPYEDDVKHVASALASFALTPCGSAEGIPVPADLAEVHDLFVTNRSLQDDLTAQLMGGASIILLAGFLRGTENKRHNIKYFHTLAQGFYGHASDLSRDASCKKMFKRLAVDAPRWSDICFGLHQSLKKHKIRINLK